MKVAMTMVVMTTLIRTMRTLIKTSMTLMMDDVADDGDNIRRFVERQSVTFHPGPGGSCFSAE